MKKLSLVILALIGIQMSALAAGKTMVSYQFGHENTVFPTPYAFEKVTASVDETGVLTVSSVTTRGFDATEPSVVLTRQLSESSVDFLRNELLSLSDAEIQSSYSDIVCMIAVSPAQMIDHLSVATNWDWQKNQFLGELRTVMGPQGCWVHHHIAPKVEWQMNQARGLKKMLQLLALDLAGDILK
ncbi:MAG: hypothetical protein H6624_11845 [Bdellovibrionaceae bacterium]|nr:hypothetical protein [Bdellovibrionales bacterium]MCB9085033.1 hypothetical protein [Pseudobdellovibrionaceae bacterium]